MKLSLSQAAKEAGKSKSTISRAIKDGDLSATKVGNKFEIEPSELFRAFPKRSDANEQKTGQGTVREPHLSNENKELRDKLHAAEVELSGLRAERAANADNLADLRTQLEQAREREIRLVTAPPPAPSTKRKFWGLFG